MKGENGQLLNDIAFKCEMAKQSHVSGKNDKRENARALESGNSSCGKHLLKLSPGLMKSSSLQGIHAQSSTETSGLGETITSGFSSQESVHDGTRVTVHPRGEPSDNIQPAETNEKSSDDRPQSTADRPGQIRSVGHGQANTAKTSSGSNTSSTVRAFSSPDTNVRHRHVDGLKRRHPSLEMTIDMPGNNNNNRALGPAAACEIAGGERRYSDELSNFDDLFVNNRGYRAVDVTGSMHSSPSKPMSTVSGYGNATSHANPRHSIGLQPEQIDEAWKNRRKSVQSLSSLGGGSFRSRSGSTRGSKRFLGINTESRWLRWSKERRLSYRRKQDCAKKNNEDVDRVPTPVKKARKECLKFVHPDLEHKYLSEEELKDHHLQQQVQQQYYYGMLEARNEHGMHLTILQWHLLADYWDHKVFIQARYVGVCVSFLALLFAVIALTNYQWMTYLNVEDKGDVIQGLWVNCYHDNVAREEVCESFTTSYHAGLWGRCYENHTDLDALAICPLERTHWQNAVIGFMLFSASFGFLASVLSILGVCTTPLPKKIYYFHSSGEIFLICAVSCTFALLIYPMSIELDAEILDHRYGVGYGLGWGAAFFFYAAALCMSLDEIVKASSAATCCKRCWNRSDADDRADLRQV